MYEPLTYYDRLKIREFYKRMEPQILSAIGWGFDKYKFPYLDRLSPIEKEVWKECVTAGLVMYPEYPVGPFWVDFGNPRTRIAIECDGTEWHKDKVIDANRDERICSEFGWTVFRISGAEIMQHETTIPDDPTDDSFSRWIQSGGLCAFISRIVRFVQENKTCGW